MDKKQFKILGIGLAAGLVNGLFGSGGGTLVVPALVFLLNVDDHKAHATAISIILPLSIVSVLIYYRHNIVKLNIAFIVALGGMLGSFLGAKLLNKVPVNILRKIFGSLNFLSYVCSEQLNKAQ